MRSCCRTAEIHLQMVKLLPTYCCSSEIRCCNWSIFEKIGDALKPVRRPQQKVCWILQVINEPGRSLHQPTGSYKDSQVRAQAIYISKNTNMASVSDVTCEWLTSLQSLKQLRLEITPCASRRSDNLASVISILETSLNVMEPTSAWFWVGYNFCDWTRNPR